MNRSKLLGGVALAACVALAASACSSSKTNSGSSAPTTAVTTLPSGNTSAATGFNAAVTGIVRPTDAEGGTMTLVDRSDFDSLDPGNTYDAFSWSIIGDWARPLMTYAQQPGNAGAKVVPDLAEGPGVVSNNGMTWTYKIKPGVKYQDGSVVTSADVKYAIERSNWGQDTLVNGPAYLPNFIQDTTKYAGPYKDKNPNDGVSGITTPDNQTIVFNLTSPFSDFDYLMALPGSAPVPRAKDTGADYFKTLLSTGQYKVDNYQVGNELDLSPNPNFDKSTDPDKLHVVRASKIVVKLKQDKATIDDTLFDGSANADLTGVGVQPATQSKILGDPKLKADSDSAYANSTEYFAINATQKPFDNVNCRQAIEWIIDKATLQTEAGGSQGGGDIASTIDPPTIPGWKAGDQYLTAGNKGDATKAKASLAQCKTAEPDAFNADGSIKDTFEIMTRDNSTKEATMVQTTQTNLKSIGINTTIDTKPFDKYNSQFAGNKTYVDQHKVAISFMKWGADFPSGYGFMYSLLASSAIHPSGGYNLSWYKDDAIDQGFTKALGENDPTARGADYAAIDHQALADALVVPLIWDKNLVYRPESTTNVIFSQGYGMYIFSAMGVK
ncbi:extracellular solute-binding protein family 5 [Catenulispora acidiphila DSM 44928]|uniref:Extracellular solute-binding protein family 5 n=1 Tax=Catenulispora acidiphila (strain DSM 44928 / JCM 14897 / NBRC 102108 / NRRL B-24433 / ID139908) TaxID=479433 RepID=C7Q7C6_CATAD|nr:ABC transporter substrate-binding protein [Catenulispora acidiphila]ACU70214.1 extracellular solute-binding protein family 5 [Catenulispora acidiphila DSM 44928]